MKKPLLAASLLAATCVASAQSGVTIFGIVDTAFEHVSNRSGDHVNRVISSGWQTSRLGFRGVEDLGGGLTANFWLETGLNTDDGTGVATNTNNQANGTAGGGSLSFNRRSTVGLAGPWGEARLGRDYTPGIWNLLTYDPFLNVGVGASQAFNSAITGVTSVRASNAIVYLTPNTLSGFFGHLMHWRGENLSGTVTHDDGTGTGFRVGYTSGPLEIALSMNRTQLAAGDIHQNNLGGVWNFGFAKVMGSVSRDRNGTATGRGGLVGLVAPIGSGELKFAYSRYHIDRGATDPTAAKLAVGYGYFLSKRTTLYAAYGHVHNTSGSTATVSTGAPAAAAGQPSSGFDLGIRHTF